MYAIRSYYAMVKGIKAAFFCEYLQEVDIKGSETIPVIVEIKHLYVDDQIVTDKEKMKLKLDVIGRVGKNYARLQDIRITSYNVCYTKLLRVRM